MGFSEPVLSTKLHGSVELALRRIEFLTMTCVCHPERSRGISPNVQRHGAMKPVLSAQFYGSTEFILSMSRHGSAPLTMTLLIISAIEGLMTHES